ncbi:PREDICTED: histone-arginine methyltransferase CARM1-like [Colobus angolensis palliatus]|uniref:histone-arginine methyltransferase CARM1-like n=1 Tax=Colobus angolensis palliatus TaxID=336983 RepID=UPI0005F4EE05|nr:PREDICTED: histone-arginine methyltransferase CARM1-like [Colobus angolensis palliatus]
MPSPTQKLGLFCARARSWERGCVRFSARVGMRVCVPIARAWSASVCARWACTGMRVCPVRLRVQRCAMSPGARVKCGLRTRAVTEQVWTPSSSLKGNAGCVSCPDNVQMDPVVSLLLSENLVAEEAALQLHPKLSGERSCEVEKGLSGVYTRLSGCCSQCGIHLALLFGSKRGLHQESTNAVTWAPRVVDDAVCVFKCLLNRDTECCRVGKESILITLGYSSALLKFESHAEFSAFANTLKICRNQKKEYLVVSQWTEACAAQYFQFYGCISRQQNMMQDFVRTATYHRAILQNHIDFRDKVVLDVGCGSGILSFFAIQAGARRVYAVEASSVAQYAEMLVKNNHLSDKIIVLPGKIEDISLPEAVDVIISEPMGYMLFNERMLESYLLSKKWLKSNGMMFPTFSDIHLAPFSDEQLYVEHFSRANFWYQQCFYRVNLSSLRGAAVDEYFRQPIVDTFDVRILMAQTVKYTVNFMDAGEEDLHRVEIPFVFQMAQSGLIHGLAFWFDVAFVGFLVTVWLSTAPAEPLTHWYQVRCLLQTPLFAKEGEKLSGKVLFVANKRQSYDIQIVALANQTGFRSENILDLKNPFFR